MTIVEASPAAATSALLLCADLGAELPQTAQLQQDEFQKLATACQAGNTPEANDACGSAST